MNKNACPKIEESKYRKTVPVVSPEELLSQNCVEYKGRLMNSRFIGNWSFNTVMDLIEKRIFFKVEEK